MLKLKQLQQQKQAAQQAKVAEQEAAATSGEAQAAAGLNGEEDRNACSSRTPMQLHG